MIAISRPRLAAVTLAVGLFGVSFPANAQLTLTAAGVADGFTLVPFVSGYSFGGGINYGPLAQGILPNGTVVTGSFGDDKIYVFNDVNNQTLASAISATPYTFTTGNPQWAMATAGGQVYGAQIQASPIMQFSNGGTFAPMGPVGSPVRSLNDNLGLWGDPVNGHLIAAASNGLVDITPSTGAVRVINSSLFPDGVTVSPDGTKIFAALGGNVSVLAGDSVCFRGFGTLLNDCLELLARPSSRSGQVRNGPCRRRCHQCGDDCFTFVSFSDKEEDAVACRDVEVENFASHRLNQLPHRWFSILRRCKQPLHVIMSKPPTRY